MQRLYDQLHDEGFEVVAVSVDAPKVTVAELAKNAKAGEDPKAAVAKTVNVAKAVAARASIAKRS